MPAGMRTGVLNLRKPVGITSHRLVEQVRRVLGGRRVGHGGTLDPFADGVLLMAFGPGTKILPYLGELPKEYVATLLLGEETGTLDTEGEVVRRLPVPDFSLSAVEEVLAGFRGTSEQATPLFSAVKVGGVRAYDLARQGIEVALPPRTITVDDIALLSWEPPVLRFRALVSRGTYLRQLGSDLAAALGTCGHLTALTRTAVGPHTLDRSHTVEELEASRAAGRLEDMVLTLPEALAHLPVVRLDAEGVGMVRHGLHPEGHCSQDGALPPGALAAAVGPDGRLVAVLRGNPADAPVPFSFDRVLHP